MKGTQGITMPIGVNLRENPFEISFPARGWKCTLLRFCRESGRRSLHYVFPVRDWEQENFPFPFAMHPLSL